MDSETAGLLSQAVPEPTSTAYLDARPAAEGDASHATQPSTTPYIPGAVLLPRMPLGLQFVTTVQTYTAVATVVRSLAAVAVAADARAGQGSRGGSSTCAYLQTLVQACLQNLQSQVVRGNPEAADVSSGVKKKSGMKQRKAPQPITPAAQGSDLQPWQLSAAQVIALLAEVLFGACPAGTAGMQIKTSNGTAQTDATADNVSKELETAVAAALPEVVDELIWSLPTSFQQSTGYGAAPQGVGTSIAPMLPPTGAAARQRGWNALLQRAALDCIGTAARALGQRFTANGRTLRVILLPTLEKLGEPCALVSAAAQAAVTSFCVYCGYGGSGGGLRQLVADNADYIVDGMCLQLRQPHAHPRAPQLFATLLRQSGVAPGLLPLLAEPARQALQGVSIIARRRRPEHVLPFVLCIREIAKGAGVVAAEALADHETFAAVLERRWDAQQEKNAAEKASQDAVNADDGAEDDQAVKMEDIARFFEERRAQEVDEASNVPGALEDHPAAHERVAVSLAEWNDVQLTRRRAVACATLAQSAADTAGPLALSSSLPVAVQALRGCREALHALASASRCHELFAQSIEVRMAPPGGVTVPGECNPATLLPSVHLLWSPLMGSLDDWRIGVVECALESLSDLACLAGSFLTRRFGQEAWPKMERLLREGPSLQRIIAPGQDDLRSPVVVQRAQRAVLNCLREIAAGGDEAASVLAPLAHSLLAAVAEVMGEAHPSPVREVATSAFAALAGVDPDAAWALLVTALRSIRVAAVRHPEQPSSEFPAFEALCPLPRGGAVPSGLRSCGEAKLQALVQQVGFMPARWHDHADRLLTASF